MPKKIQKCLQEYLSKMKNPTPNSKNWILSGCKHHPKTLSFAIDRRNHGSQDQDNSAASLSDVDRFLFETFRSLYMKDDEDQYHKNKGEKHVHLPHSPVRNSFKSPRFIDRPPELFGSNRFFKNPDSTDSLIAEARLSLTSTSEDRSSSSRTSSNTLDSSTAASSNEVRNVSLPDDCIAMVTYSPNPYDDFRHSMQEMVKTRLLKHAGKVDWESMEEMLICYLNLNGKKSHKFILSAFVDIVAGLRKNSSNLPVRLQSSRNARERRK